MTEFTKTKIHFALALLGSLFALHPFLEKYEGWGFLYLGYDLKVLYAYGILAGLLALCVYCYGLTLLSEKPHSSLEKLGNYVYALAVLVVPLYGGLYLSSLLAERLGQTQLAWAAPTVAFGLAIAWIVLSQIAALLLRGRLGRQDRTSNLEKLAQLEVAALNHAREMFESEHYDLAIIETWRAVEARLRRVLLAQGANVAQATPEALIRAAKRAAIVGAPAVALLDELQKQYQGAVGTEPSSRESAEVALSAGRHILATIAIPQRARGKVA
jgi:hypothetical protein